MKKYPIYIYKTDDRLNIIKVFLVSHYSLSNSQLSIFLPVFKWIEYKSTPFTSSKALIPSTNFTLTMHIAVTLRVKLFTQTPLFILKPFWLLHTPCPICMHMVVNRWHWIECGMYSLCRNVVGVDYWVTVTCK